MGKEKKDLMCIYYGHSQKKSFKVYHVCHGEQLNRGCVESRQNLAFGLSPHKQ